MPPLYRQIAADLRARLTSGVVGPGDKLPTEPQLMERYGVSRNTVRLATALLINEGLVERVAGRSGGMVVRDRITLSYHATRAEMPNQLYGESAWISEVEQQGYDASQRFELQVTSLTAELAARLGVQADSAAALRRCVRFVNGQPSSIQDTYYPMDLCEQVPELLSPRDISGGTTRLLAQRGFPQPAFEDDLAASMPGPDHVQLLDLPAGTPVLHYVRTGFSPERPIRVSVTVFAGDRNRVIYTLGDGDVIARFRSQHEE